MIDAVYAWEQAKGGTMLIGFCLGLLAAFALDRLTEYVNRKR